MKNNKTKIIPNYKQKLGNYWTPLTSQVGELEMINQNISDGIGYPSVLNDSGATYNCGREGSDFILSNIPSKQLFHMPNGDTERSIVKAKIDHNLKEPARPVYMVTGLKYNLLISARKFAGAKYITILTEDEFNIYDGKTTNIIVSEEELLRGWRCKDAGLWIIILNKAVKNGITNTLLINIIDPKMQSTTYTI